MPFLLAEILNFQGSTHFIGVGSLSKVIWRVRDGVAEQYVSMPTKEEEQQEIDIAEEY